MIVRSWYTAEKMSQGGMGYHIKAAGTVINADGSVSGWSIAEDDDGGQTRNSTKLDKDKKDTWADKIHEKQKAKVKKQGKRQRHGCRSR